MSNKTFTAVLVFIAFAAVIAFFAWYWFFINHCGVTPITSEPPALCLENL